jgi:hypothetical protein
MSKNKQVSSRGSIHRQNLVNGQYRTSGLEKLVRIDRLANQSGGHRTERHCGVQRKEHLCTPGPGLGRLYASCKGGNDEVGGDGWKIGAQATLVPTFAKSQRWAGDRPMRTLNSRSLHSTDHRFAMICSGRDDRVAGLNIPSQAKPGLSGTAVGRKSKSPP